MTTDELPSCVVRFEDGVRMCEVVVPGRLLVVPPSIHAERVSSELVLLSPIQGSGNAADTVAGSIPLVSSAAGEVAVTFLELPPPAPFDEAAVAQMWDEIVAAGAPLPDPIDFSRRVLSGTLVSSEQVLLDFVGEAHSYARILVSDWPTIETTTTVWRPLDVVGGREDLIQTERSGGRHPRVHTLGGRVVPTHTARRVGHMKPWRSSSLATAARRLSEELQEVLPMGAGSDSDFVGLLRPFVAVEEVARPEMHVPDPPMSTWPPAAAETYQRILMALAAVRASQDGRGPKAPLCYFWRLYEAWVAVRTRGLISRSEERSISELYSLAAKRCEWATTWDVSDGSSVTLLAQPQVGKDGSDFGGVISVKVRSISSDLRPDLMIVVQTPSGQFGCVALDAKRRSAEAIDPRDVAEAASKYVWGIRFGASAGTQGVASTIIATTALAPSMHDAESRILAARLLPEDEDEFQVVVETAILAAYSGAL